MLAAVEFEEKWYHAVLAGILAMSQLCLQLVSVAAWASLWLLYQSLLSVAVG